MNKVNMCILIFSITILFVGDSVFSEVSNYTDTVVVKFSSNINEYESPVYEMNFYVNEKKIAKRIYQHGLIKFSEGEIPDGEVVELYPSGKVKNIISYKDGVRNGKVTGYYENGGVKLVSEYINDNPNGITKKFYKNGVLMVESKIVDGSAVYYKSYNINGTLNEHIQYEDGIPKQIK